MDSLLFPILFYEKLSLFHITMLSHAIIRRSPDTNVISVSIYISGYPNVHAGSSKFSFLSNNFGIIVRSSGAIYSKSIGNCETQN